MLQKLFLLWLAALPLMGSPGPATLSVAGVGMAFGVTRGLGYLTGIITGTVGVLLLIATGITGIILTEPALVLGISVLAAVYILYLAWKIATAPVTAHQHHTTKAPTFIGGFVLAIANPKAYAAIGAVFAGHSLIGDNILLDAAAKIAGLTAVICVVNAAWLAFGAALSSVLSDPKTGRVANIIFAAMLVASVGYALLTLLYA